MGLIMARLTTRINIHGLCRTYDLWTGSVSAGDKLGEGNGALDGVKPSTWNEQGSNRTEKSFLVDEGEMERNIPYYVFNILQAAETEPGAVLEIVLDEVPEADEKFDLVDLDTGTDKWYKELVEVLVYLSVDKYDGYGQRYWYQPWRKAKERNPDLLGEGRMVRHPGKDAEEVEEDPIEAADNVQSAADASW